MDHPSTSPDSTTTTAQTTLLEALVTELRELLVGKNYVSLEDLYTVGRLSRAARLLVQVQNPLSRFDDSPHGASLPPPPPPLSFPNPPALGVPLGAPFVDPMDECGFDRQYSGPAVLRARRSARETQAAANAESPIAQALHAQLASLLGTSPISPSTLVQLAQTAEHGSELLRGVLGIPSPPSPQPHRGYEMSSSSSETFGATAIREIVAASAKPQEDLAATVSALAVARDKGLDDVARTLESRLGLKDSESSKEST